MILETRVGYMATNVLEEIARETIISDYKNKDYKSLVNNIKRYIDLRIYNK